MPGLLARVVEVFVKYGANIAAQYLQTEADIGYSVIDVEGDLDTEEILEDLRAIPGTLRARFLFERR
jgi:D-3-phosphoglycerate dehydrogenase